MSPYRKFIIIAGCFMYFQSFTQGIGLGYNSFLGWQNGVETGKGYTQQKYTTMHEGFFRTHNKSGQNSLQIGVGFRIDSIHFTNQTEFLGDNGYTIKKFTTDAVLQRKAWRMSCQDNMQFGRKPGNTLFALSCGLYVENTMNIQRKDLDDNYVYSLFDEINRVTFGMMLGAEFRYSWFTIGYKFDKLFKDVLDHEYINSLPIRTGNNSELRGLRLGTSMSMFYMGIALDFFFH